MAGDRQHPASKALKAAHTAIGFGNLDDAEALLNSLKSMTAAAEHTEALTAWLRVRSSEQHFAMVEAFPTQEVHWLNLSDSLWQLRLQSSRREALEDGLRHCPNSFELARRLIELHQSVKDHVHAVECARVALEHHPEHPTLLKQQAEAMVAIAHPDAVLAIAADLRANPESWLRCFDHYLRMGAFESADRVLTAELNRHPTEPIRRSAAGRLALWRTQYAKAMEIGAELVREHPSRPEGHFLLGAAGVMTGDPTAEPHLHRALERPVNDSWLEPYEVRSFVAERLFMDGQYVESRDMCQEVRGESRGFNWISVFCFARAVVSTVDPQKAINPRQWEAFLMAPELIEGGPKQWKDSGSMATEMASLITHKLGGNRSRIPAWWDGERLRLTPIAPSSIEERRAIQLGLRTQPTAHLRARFEELIQRFPDDPGAYTYHGEMLLWIGEYEASIEQFKLAIGRKHLTVWAWIGWGAALALLGKGDEALNKLSEGIEEANFEGPTVYVYRGEIHRRAGRLEQARSDLQIAVQSKPERISGWINRALVDHQEGHSEPSRVLGRAIRNTNPNLWWTACAAAKQPPLSLAGSPVVLETILDLMRGNRSSAIPTYILGTRVCFIEWRASHVPPELVARYG